MPFQRPIEVPNRQRLYQLGPDIHEILQLGVPLGINSWDDDFQGDTLHGGYQSTASGGASAAAAIAAGLVGGQILLNPGTANDGRSDLSLGLHYLGNRFAAIWWKVRLTDAVTSVKLELGFTDVISGTDAGAVATKATPTFNAADCAVLVLDTDDDSNLTLVGNQNGSAATAYDFSATLVANTFYWFGLVLRETRAAGYLCNAAGRVLERQPASGYMENAITQTVALTPWAFVQNRSASQRQLHIDRLKAYQLEESSQ
tara:strand:+ start:30 stop:803 length:774 start_codon:yes stop_codon:yes gene_type:complete